MKSVVLTAVFVLAGCGEAFTSGLDSTGLETDGGSVPVETDASDAGDVVVPATGGRVGSGGTPSNGGMLGSGGALANGGAGSGGAVDGAGGAPAAGGAVGSGGQGSGGALGAGGTPTGAGGAGAGGIVGSGGSGAGGAPVPCNGAGLSVHHTGTGLTWTDCVPVGTYDSVQAMKACETWCAANACTAACFAGAVDVYGNGGADSVAFSEADGARMFWLWRPSSHAGDLARSNPRYTPGVKIGTWD